MGYKTSAGQQQIDFNLQLVIDQHPLHGSVSPNSPFPNQTAITYTAVTGYAGPDQFTYYAKDSQGFKSNTGTMSITIDAGYSQLAIFNCNQDMRTIYIWLHDLSSGNWVNKGSLDAQYDPIYGCPNPNATPLIIELTSGVRYELSCLDPQLPACSSGSSDPTDTNCQRYFLQGILGDAKGAVKPISVP